MRGKCKALQERAWTAASTRITDIGITSGRSAPSESMGNTILLVELHTHHGEPWRVSGKWGHLFRKQRCARRHFDDTNLETRDTPCKGPAARLWIGNTRTELKAFHQYLNQDLQRSQPRFKNYASYPGKNDTSQPRTAYWTNCQAIPTSNAFRIADAATTTRQNGTNKRNLGRSDTRLNCRIMPQDLRTRKRHITSNVSRRRNPDGAVDETKRIPHGRRPRNQGSRRRTFALHLKFARRLHLSNQVLCLPRSLFVGLLQDLFCFEEDAPSPRQQFFHLRQPFFRYSALVLSSEAHVMLAHVFPDRMHSEQRGLFQFGMATQSLPEAAQRSQGTSTISPFSWTSNAERSRLEVRRDILCHFKWQTPPLCVRPESWQARGRVARRREDSVTNQAR